MQWCPRAFPSTCHASSWWAFIFDCTCTRGSMWRTSKRSHDMFLGLRDDPQPHIRRCRFLLSWFIHFLHYYRVRYVHLRAPFDVSLWCPHFLCIYAVELVPTFHFYKACKIFSCVIGFVLCLSNLLDISSWFVVCCKCCLLGLHSEICVLNPQEVERHINRK